jgi:RimJ/RimL family protein N-acetyltransferase
MEDQVSLRQVVDSDLPIFFEQQLDSQANIMAAFTSKDPADEGAFRAHWAKIRSDSSITNRTVQFGGKVAGHVASFKDKEFGKPEVTYWIGKEYWGKGIATEALRQLLELVKIRPIYARVARDNLGSLSVLKKCHFEIIGSNVAFAEARGKEIEELILQLD